MLGVFFPMRGAIILPDFASRPTELAYQVPFINSLSWHTKESRFPNVIIETNALRDSFNAF